MDSALQKRGVSSGGGKEEESNRLVTGGAVAYKMRLYAFVGVALRYAAISDGGRDGIAATERVMFPTGLNGGKILTLPGVRLQLKN